MNRLLLALVWFSSASLATAADWPQFLGPQRNNTTTEELTPWTDAPQVLWKQPVGEAHSSPVVANGKVFAFFKPQGKDEDALAAYDAKTGTKLWENSYVREQFNPPFGVGPRGTPAVDGKQIFTLGGTGILAAWDIDDGSLLWKIDTLKLFHAKNLFFGVSTSPIVVGEQVIIMVGGKDAGIVSFAKKDGSVLWRESSDNASYAGPIVDDTKLVFLTGNHLRAVDLEGKSVWAFPFVDRLNESSTTPVVVNDYIVAGSVTRGSFAFPRDGNATKPVWLNDKLTCYFSTPCVVGTDIYMVNGSATLLNPSIVLRCVDGLTGKIRWEQKNVGKYHAALVQTKNQKLLMLDDLGQLRLFEPNPKEYKELAKSKVCGETWAHPAVADGIIYLRDNKELIALRLN